MMCRYTYMLKVPAKDRYSYSKDKEVGFYECDTEEYIKMIEKIGKNLRCSYVELADGRIYVCYWKGYYSNRRLVFEKIKDINEYMNIIKKRRMEARTNQFLKDIKSGLQRTERNSGGTGIEIAPMRAAKRDGVGTV